MTPQARSYTPPTLDVTNMAGNGNQISVSVLVNADMQSESQQEPVKTTASNLKLEDLFDGIKASLLKVIEWAKRLPAFGSLSLDDQVKLLKSSWCEHCVLKIAARNGPKSDTILLSNGLSCNKDNVEDPEVRRVLQRVFSELAYWLDYLNVDRVELACLKGILLFNPGKCNHNALPLCCHKYVRYWPIRSLTVFPDVAKISLTLCVCMSCKNACTCGVYV